MEHMSVKSYISILKLQRLHRITNWTPHFTGQQAKQSKIDKNTLVTYVYLMGLNEELLLLVLSIIDKDQCIKIRKGFLRMKVTPKMDSWWRLWLLTQNFHLIGGIHDDTNCDQWAEIPFTTAVGQNN